MNPSVYMPIITLIASLVGSGIGVFVGMKVGLARLETWRDIAAVEIKEMRKDLNVHGDDLLVHDMEIGALVQRAGMERIRRQTAR